MADIRSKSLSALCRMVIYPLDYSHKYTDTDLDHHNIVLTKKKRIQDMPDVIFAQKIANHLITKLELDIRVCHQLIDTAPYDFIFTGNSFLDPGEAIDCQKYLQAEIV